MKSKKILTVMAIAMIFMAPQQASAQFWKQLGKAAESVGKAVLESSTTQTQKSSSSANNVASVGKGQRIVTGHPDFKIEIKRCAASGTNVVLDLVVTNVGGSDVKQFRVHGGTYSTKLYDNLGNIYERDIYVKIANKEYTDYQYEIRLVSGLATNFSILVKDVDQRATSFVLVEPDIYSTDWGITKETVKLRNIPITREEEE